MSSSRRFTATHGNDRLLELVVEISRWASSNAASNRRQPALKRSESEKSPEAPDQVSQRSFDAARAPAGHPDCPSARQIVARFGCPWRELLDITHNHWNDRQQRLGVRGSDRRAKGFSLEQCLNAIAQAARALGRDTINRRDYTDAVELMAAADERAWRHGSPEKLMSVLQIENVLRQEGLTWKQACLKAGLRDPAAASHGLSPQKAVAAFAQEFGCVPVSRPQLRSWAKARGVSLAHLSGAEVRAVAAAHSAQHTPNLPTAARDLVFEPSPAPTGSPAQRRRNANRTWDKSSLIAGIALAIRMLPPGQALGTRELNQVARSNPELAIPSYNTVKIHIAKHQAAGDQNASWDTWKRAAVKQASG